MDFVCYISVEKSSSGVNQVEINDTVQSSAIQRAAALQTEKDHTHINVYNYEPEKLFYQRLCILHLYTIVN